MGQDANKLVVPDIGFPVSCCTYCRPAATTSKSAHLGPQPDLSDVLCEAPALLATLCSQDSAALSCCSRQLRGVIHSSVKAITVKTDRDVAAVLEGNWSNLGLIKMRPSVLSENGSMVHRPEGNNFEVLASLHATYPRQYATPFVGLHSTNNATAYIVKVTAQQSQLDQHSQLHRLFAAAFSNLQNAGWGQTDSLRINIRCHADQLIEHLTVSDWPNMQRLVLSHNQLGSPAVEHLPRGSWPQLKELDLGGNQLDKAAMTALLHGKWPSLVGLSLNANPALDASAIAVIAQAPRWAALSRLSLSKIKISSGSARSILLMHGCLESLNLSYTNIDAAGLSELFAKPWPQLQYLRLEGNSLQADAIATLVSVSLPRLTVLRLSQNRLDVNAARLLATGEWQLQHLTLNQNNLDTAAMAFLATGKWPALFSLDLHDNNIGVLGLEPLMAGQWPQLQRLTLNFGSVTEANWRLLNLAPSTMPSSMGRNKFASVSFSRHLTVDECIWPKLKSVRFMQTPIFAVSVYQGQDNKVAVKSVEANTDLLTRPDAPTSTRVLGCGGQVAKTSSREATPNALDKSTPTWIEVLGWCTIACLSICFVRKVCYYTSSK